MHLADTEGPVKSLDEAVHNASVPETGGEKEADLGPFGDAVSHAHDPTEYLGIDQVLGIRPCPPVRPGQRRPHLPLPRSEAARLPGDHAEPEKLKGRLPPQHEGTVPYVPFALIRSGLSKALRTPRIRSECGQRGNPPKSDRAEEGEKNRLSRCSGGYPVGSSYTGGSHDSPSYPKGALGTHRER